MTHRNKIILFSVLFATSFSVRSQDFVEGTHFSQLKTSKALERAHTKTEREVVEYFSFSCPGCYAIEPAIEALIGSKSNLKVRKVHMPYGGQKAKYSQKAFALMTLLNAQHHKNLIFNRIHRTRNVFDTDEELIDFFQSLGYERSKVAATLNSFTVDSLVRKMNLEGKTNMISSVPTIVVNNRYKINIRAVNTAAELGSLIEHLNSLPN